mmetsp:Transcript_21496/g.59735  ORF Transcript_21496/g.59735 Transcript_21496/m.59735 type:complete len:210 (-) Transcript_21496:2219-2848(-)
MMELRDTSPGVAVCSEWRLSRLRLPSPPVVSSETSAVCSALLRPRRWRLRAVKRTSKWSTDCRTELRRLAGTACGLGVPKVGVRGSLPPPLSSRLLSRCCPVLSSLTLASTKGKGELAVPSGSSDPYWRLARTDCRRLRPRADKRTLRRPALPRLESAAAAAFEEEGAAAAAPLLPLGGQGEKSGETVGIASPGDRGECGGGLAGLWLA